MIKNQVGIPIGMSGDHPDLLPLVNSAIQELWNEVDFIGKFQIYKIRVSGDCDGNRYITWPRQVETIEALQSCNTPIGVRNMAFEFIENAPGDLATANKFYGPRAYSFGAGGPGRLLGDRSEVCTSEDINSKGKKVKAYNALPMDDGFQIIILGYDNDGQWIRTLQGGVYVDGEYLTLSSNNPPITTNYFSTITGIQFSATPRSGNIYITEYDPINPSEERWLSTYEYDEEIPVYRRSILTGLPRNNCPCVTALVRIRFYPIAKDRDYVQIGNIEAIKNQLVAMQRRDNGKRTEYKLAHQDAVDNLNMELRQYQGVAPKKVISFAKRYTWGSSNNVM